MKWETFKNILKLRYLTHEERFWEDSFSTNSKRRKYLQRDLKEVFNVGADSDQLD